MSCPLFLSEAPLLIGSAVIENSCLISHAVASGFMCRKPQKISPRAFLQSFLDSVLKRSPSFNDLAAEMEAVGNPMASRQAVAQRCTAAALLFIQAIFGEFLAQHIFPDGIKRLPGCWSDFSRVIVADSTLLKLPAWLFEAFSGTANATTQSCNCRIQAAYDLVAMQFIYFSIDPYSKNDLAAAPDLVLQAGDLVLRDRGYLTAGEIQRHLVAEADCIYRHITGTTYLEPDTKLPFDLLAHLQEHGEVNKIVCLNNPAFTQIRLVGAAIDEESANIRRMRAKRETRGHAPSAAVLAMMSWSVYLVTDALRKCTFKDLLAIYGLRWRIEIIFKSWKSHLGFAKIHHLSEIQLRILLTVRLMLIMAYTDMFYGPCQRRLKKEAKCELSLIKFIHYLALHPGKIEAIRLYVTAVPGGKNKTATKQHCLHVRQLLVKYCCYDKRKRPNFNTQWASAA